ncbi:hypothetical protein LAZ40_13210 [Cereibacter sphaeroides]|uniref:hypothetical protein n=1 Tax=Cereibacter sphaeroides TaxID=1063 RepID=UPI001F2B1451|nr:hypothetical protein [Cereibacter sphaeroides]MCE6959980.1 hypothetical protein [Cereibacter sphaeroides]MCE6973065.1 hypothetical protein [Cereibacter sphaeroides]
MTISGMDATAGLGSGYSGAPRSISDERIERRRVRGVARAGSARREVSYSAAELVKHRDFWAMASVEDEVFLPIFERFEIELERARGRESADPVEAARALLRASKAREN